MSASATMMSALSSPNRIASRNRDGDVSRMQVLKSDSVDRRDERELWVNVVNYVVGSRNLGKLVILWKFVLFSAERWNAEWRVIGDLGSATARGLVNESRATDLSIALGGR